MTLYRKAGTALLVALTTAWMTSFGLAQDRVTKPGDALPGLSPREFTEFRLGLDDFTEVETSEEGLGPAFNGTSCAVCHNVPAIGGTSTILETRAGRLGGDGEFQARDASGAAVPRTRWSRRT